MKGDPVTPQGSLRLSSLIREVRVAPTTLKYGRVGKEVGMVLMTSVAAHRHTLHRHSGASPWKLVRKGGRPGVGVKPAVKCLGKRPGGCG